MGCPALSSVRHSAPSPLKTVLMTYNKSTRQPVGRVKTQTIVSPAAAYVLQTPALNQIANRLRTLKKSKHEAGLFLKAEALFDATANRFCANWYNEMFTPQAEIPQLPGSLIFATVHPKTQEVENLTFSELEIWEQPLAGVDTMLVEHLDKLNDDRSRAEQPLLNVAMWVTGYFDANIPLHVILCDADKNVMPFFALDGTFVPCHLELMHAALPILRERFKNLAAETADAGVCAPTNIERRQAAEFFAYKQMVILRDGIDAGLDDKADALNALKDAWQRDRAALVADGLSRRKAAVASKNLQIDTLTKRAKLLERQLTDVKHVFERELGELRELVKSGSAAPASSPAPVAPLADSPVATPPPVMLADGFGEYYSETIDHQAEVIRQMRVTTQHLQAELAAAKGEPAVAVAKPAAPRRLRDIADWAAENADRIILIKRAINSAKKATYVDEELVFKTLDMLATTYRDVKLNLIDRMAFREACDQLGLDCGGSIAECVPDEYFFDWKGRRTFMDQHVGRGVAREPRFCFRAYFTWDAEEAKVVVGWLPSHLPTRST